MSNDFLSWEELEETQAPELCGVQVVVNSVRYACECPAGHAGAHSCGVKTDYRVYDCFDWQIDARGAVVIDASVSVAAVLFSQGTVEPF